jgi:hypothetical protein
MKGKGKKGHGIYKKMQNIYTIEQRIWNYSNSMNLIVDPLLFERCSALPRETNKWVHQYRSPLDEVSDQLEWAHSLLHFWICHYYQIETPANAKMNKSTFSKSLTTFSHNVLMLLGCDGWIYIHFIYNKITN